MQTITFDIGIPRNHPVTLISNANEQLAREMKRFKFGSTAHLVRPGGIDMRNGRVRVSYQIIEPVELQAGVP